MSWGDKHFLLTATHVVAGYQVYVPLNSRSTVSPIPAELIKDRGDDLSRIQLLGPLPEPWKPLSYPDDLDEIQENSSPKAYVFLGFPSSRTKLRKQAPKEEYSPYRGQLRFLSQESTSYLFSFDKEAEQEFEDGSKRTFPDLPGCSGGPVFVVSKEGNSKLVGILTDWFKDKKVKEVRVRNFRPPATASVQ